MGARERPGPPAQERLAANDARRGKGGHGREGAPGRAHFLSVSQWAMRFSAKAPPLLAFLPMNDEGGQRGGALTARSRRPAQCRVCSAGAAGNSGKQPRGMGIAGLPPANQLPRVLCDCPWLKSRSPLWCAPQRLGAAAAGMEGFSASPFPSLPLPEAGAVPLSLSRWALPSPPGASRAACVAPALSLDPFTKLLCGLDRSDFVPILWLWWILSVFCCYTLE